MLTRFSKWILFVSSYIPLYLIFIVSNLFDIYSEYNKEKLWNNYNLYTFLESININLILIVIFSLIILISFIMLNIILNCASSSAIDHDFYCIKKNNEKVNEYILVYILPFITVNSNSFKELTIFGIVFIIIGIISVKNDLVYINPILYSMKYNIYRFKESLQSSDETILISQYSIIELKRNGLWDSSNDKITIKAASFSGKVYLIKKEQ